MGTFERIRQISPYFFGFFAVMLVAYFVISDADPATLMQSSRNPQTAVVATVNGRDILRMEFEQRVQKIEEEQRQQMKDDEQEVDHVQIRRQVFQAMIEETLLEVEAEKAGIIVTEDQIRDVMIENPPQKIKQQFLDSAGNFMRQDYLRIVTDLDGYASMLKNNPNVDPRQAEEMIAQFRNFIIETENELRMQIMADQLFTAVNNAGTVYSPEAMKLEYINENTDIDMNFVQFHISSVPNDAVKVEDKEIEQYYEKHKQYYKQKPQRRIKFVNFPLQPSKEDSQRVERRVRKIQTLLNAQTEQAARDSVFDVRLSEYNGVTSDYVFLPDLEKQASVFLFDMKVGDIVGPVTLKDGVHFYRLDDRKASDEPQVRASHILINFDNNEDSARVEAEKIYQMAIGGDIFTELARKYSKDPGSARRGGDLGYFTKGRMIKEFEDAAFSADSGQVVGPIKSKFGFHIIKVADKKSEAIKYSEIHLAPRTTGITINQIKREAISFKSQIDEGVGFDEMAKRIGKTPVETPFFEKDRPLLQSQYVNDVVFASEVGEVLDPMELENYGMVVIKIVDARSEGVVPFDDKKLEIRSELLKIKKLDYLEKKVKAYYDKVKNLETLADAASIDSSAQVRTAAGVKNNGIVTGAGRDVALTQAAMTAKIGKIAGPLRGEVGYYVYQVTGRKKPDKAKIQAELGKYIQSSLQTEKRNVFNSWFEAVIENAEIEDKRMEYYREY